MNTDPSWIGPAGTMPWFPDGTAAESAAPLTHSRILDGLEAAAEWLEAGQTDLAHSMVCSLYIALVQDRCMAERHLFGHSNH